MENNAAIMVIDTVDLSQVQEQLAKINQFQQVVHKSLIPKQDFGVIPGTGKPTLLKPGAEKILMLMGIRSEFAFVDSTRDFEKGFFQYQIKCSLYKGDMLITEGFGSCNTREKKYVSQDAYSIENTVMKMAKKRALVDATLLVASLSNIFTQDIEDMDIEAGKEVKREYTDQDGNISMAQAKRIFALAHGESELVKTVLTKYNYTNSKDVKKTDYEKICSEIEAAANQ